MTLLHSSFDLTSFSGVPPQTWDHDQLVVNLVVSTLPVEYGTLRTFFFRTKKYLVVDHHPPFYPDPHLFMTRDSVVPLLTVVQRDEGIIPPESSPSGDDF